MGRDHFYGISAVSERALSCISGGAPKTLLKRLEDDRSGTATPARATAFTTRLPKISRRAGTSFSSKTPSLLTPAMEPQLLIHPFSLSDEQHDDSKDHNYATDGDFLRNLCDDTSVLAQPAYSFDGHAAASGVSINPQVVELPERPAPLLGEICCTKVPHPAEGRCRGEHRTLVNRRSDPWNPYKTELASSWRITAAQPPPTLSPPSDTCGDTSSIAAPFFMENNANNDNPASAHLAAIANDNMFSERR